MVRVHIVMFSLGAKSSMFAIIGIKLVSTASHNTPKLQDARYSFDSKSFKEMLVWDGDR